jgi:hypothetical protein
MALNGWRDAISSAMSSSCHNDARVSLSSLWDATPLYWVLVQNIDVLLLPHSLLSFLFFNVLQSSELIGHTAPMYSTEMTLKKFNDGLLIAKSKVHFTTVSGIWDLFCEMLLSGHVRLCPPTFSRVPSLQAILEYWENWGQPLHLFSFHSTL